MTLSGLLLYLNVFPPLSNHVTSTSITLGQSYWVLKGLGDVDLRVICKTHMSRIFPCGGVGRLPKDLLHVVLGFWHCLFKNPWPWTPSTYRTKTHSGVFWAMFRLLWKLLDESFFNDKRECSGMNLKRTVGKIIGHPTDLNQPRFFLFKLE